MNSGMPTPLALRVAFDASTYFDSLALPRHLPMASLLRSCIRRLLRASRHSVFARLALIGSAYGGSIQAVPTAMYCSFRENPPISNQEAAVAGNHSEIFRPFDNGVPGRTGKCRRPSRSRRMSPCSFVRTGSHTGYPVPRLALWVLLCEKRGSRRRSGREGRRGFDSSIRRVPPSYPLPETIS